MIKETGGTAFPFVSNGGIQMHQYCEGGMTLRDYFAANSIDIASREPDGTPQGSYFETAEGIASRAYLLADAMLKARNK
ncbi:hypothetical protein [Rahnella sikkimica]|uniref:Uncharacterized protein n=1 Tax=Rahnella sikkimica TaxID=1805933 RepID=A0A2L1UMV3_9GAMM|nr:hypothetical protein [Rahnella sikkimica]AVF34251.1 hypothetical protein BV494_04575 [Rahnella sikkimica]